MKKLIFQKELTLTKQVCQKNICFAIIGFLKTLDLSSNCHVCNKCHDILMTAYELNIIAILNVKGVDFTCILQDISKTKAANMLNNSVLDDKGVL